MNLFTNIKTLLFPVRSKKKIELTADERKHYLAQLENNKVFWQVLENVEDYWYNKFDNCDVNKHRERDYYHTAMKSVKFVRKSIEDQIKMVEIKKN